MVSGSLRSLLIGASPSLAAVWLLPTVVYGQEGELPCPDLGWADSAIDGFDRVLSKLSPCQCWHMW